MKKVKVIIAFVICAVMLGSMCINGYVNPYNFEIGDVIGNSVYTNVRTFVNEMEIQSYSIDGINSINDYIFLAVEDLADYYFIVEWNEETKEYHIKRDFHYEKNDEFVFTPDPKAGEGKLQTPYLSILFSDVKVYFEGNFIRSYDLDGKIVIYADDLAAFTGADYSWDNDTKELNLNACPFYIIDPVYDWEFNTGAKYVNKKLTAVNRSFNYKFRNKTEEDGEIKFSIVKSTGDYGAVQDISITGLNVSFSVYDGIELTGKYWEAVNAGVNVQNGERLEVDTHERRIELFEVFKIYINDEIAGGELITAQGNGYTKYTFKLDVPMSLEELDTVQIQVG